MGKNIFIILVCILLSCCKSSFDYKEADKNTLFVLFEESVETTKSYSLSKNEKEEVFKTPLFNYSFRNTKIKDFTLNCPAFFSFDDMFNNTNMSFGKEIENIQKQFNAEMQTRISELESLLKQKEEDMDVIILKNKQQLSD